ncbi:MAG: hypothetical protein E7519_15055 [Ruminococcaceae bacterium]|nr:hypothetical protein [Oscillospiraceae bacterium]
MSEKINVIPCSGMGKVYGLVGRESVLKVVKELCPDKADTVCLAYIVTGDDEANELIKGKKCITLDGCPAMCSAKSVELAGGNIIEKRRVLDTFRKHKGAKPGTATELTEEGWSIVDEIADEIAEKVNAFSKEG